MAAGQQQGLQLAALVAAQPGIIGGPGRGQPIAATQPVSQGGDGQCVAFGGVVAVDRIVVAEHQQRRSLAAGRQQQGRAGIGRQALWREGAAIQAGDAQCAPFRQRTALGAPGLRRLETLGNTHFHAPRFAAAPTGTLEIVGSGGQCIRNAADQIAAAVAIAVDGDARVGAGHELGVAEGAGPGTGEPLRLQVALLDQLDERQQFATKEGLAPAGTGQRGQ